VPSKFVSLHSSSQSVVYTVVSRKIHGLRTRRFITSLTRAHHRSLSWGTWIHSTPLKPISLQSILIPSSHLRLGHPSGLFPTGFPTESLYTSFSSTMRATYPAHVILLDLICLMIFGNEYKLWSFSTCKLLCTLVTLSLILIRKCNSNF
jgi:hypothetical protein